MPERIIHNAPDAAVVTGAVSSPIWLSAFTEVGQAVLIAIGIVIGLLRIEAHLRALRAKQPPTEVL